MLETHGKLNTEHHTYQLKSVSSQLLPGLTGRPAMMISQRRMVLAMTGIKPTEMMTARAAIPACQLPREMQDQSTIDILRCLRLNLNSRRSGSGKRRRITSVQTLIAPEMVMNRATSMHPPSATLMISQMRGRGTHRKSWAYTTTQLVHGRTTAVHGGSSP